jgi:hypothetical protein
LDEVCQLVEAVDYQEEGMGEQAEISLVDRMLDLGWVAMNAGCLVKNRVALALRPNPKHGWDWADSLIMYANDEIDVGIAILPQQVLHSAIGHADRTVQARGIPAVPVLLLGVTG